MNALHTLDLVVLACGLFIVIRVGMWLRRWFGADQADAHDLAVSTETDRALEANHAYLRGFALQHLGPRPTRKLAVLACMDCRLEVEAALGLGAGEAVVIRNAGGIASADALRSLLVAHHLLGIEEIIILEHTDCGMTTFRDDELCGHLERSTGTKARVRFHAFRDVRANVLRQMRRARQHPWLPQSLSVRGFVYDVKSGGLTEVVEDGKLQTCPTFRDAETWSIRPPERKEL